MGLQEMRTRVEYIDRSAQGREIKGKQKVLKDAINRSYFGFDVRKPEEDNKQKTYRVLITGTSNSLGDNELKKDISAFFDDGFKIGSIVHWLRPNSYWLIYEREQNEIAYFQGKMVEAKSYQITTVDGTHATWGNITLSLDEETETFDRTLLAFESTLIKLRIPDNELNRNAFGVDKKLKILDTTWKIYNIDYLSDPGLITLRGKRSFDSDSDIKVVENNIVNDNNYIDGPNSIIPFEEATYSIQGDIEGTWSIPDNSNIKKTINNDGTLTIVWNNARKRNDFTISYGEYTKEIHVESMV